MDWDEELGAADKPRQVKPFRQGDLDSLCGLYAAVNAMRHVTRDMQIPDSVWHDVFAILVIRTDMYVGVAHALTHGIGRKQLRRILKGACKDIKAEHQLRFRMKRIRKGRLMAEERLLIGVRELEERTQAALIVQTSGQVRHWTVQVT